MTNSIHYNLARAWRSKTFDEIIGQEMTVRILKNSLYRGQFFPVYLLSGQRGCGKTTTGRVFAAAINCARLEEFKKQPQGIILPCLTCNSCVAMTRNNHPDFIEIDAASHTGVDNVRQIIESASFLPVMGNKKIYLIDEAHMLSKAAFNAFLKILEEPPTSALFLLATTETHKIIETVKSRCFQLFFEAVKPTVLIEHLVAICEKESIAYDREGLQLIVQETEGSVRDALNLIERVRLAEEVMNKAAVLRVLGHLDDEHVLQLFVVMRSNSVPQLLDYLSAVDFSRYAATVIWKKIIELVRTLLWVKHGLAPQWFVQHQEKLTALAKSYSYAELTAFLELCYTWEAQFLKTTSQHIMLEMLLLTSMQAKQTPSVPPVELKRESKREPVVEPKIEAEIEQVPWQKFLHAIQTLGDPLLNSIFKQGKFVRHVDNTLEVAFSKEFIFYKEWLETARHKWQPLMDQIFNGTVNFVPHFVQESPASSPVGLVSPGARPSSEKEYITTKERNVRFDISDKEKWQKAHTLLRTFPGTITEVKE